MKKLLIALLALFMIITLTACNNNSKKEEEPVVVEPIIEEDTTNEKKEEPIVGGYVNVQDSTITPELNGIFTTAMQGLLGANYEPKELVATQVVAGTNYKFLASGTKTTNPITKGTYYIYIYEDLQGNVELKDIEVIEEKQEESKDPSEYSYWVVFYNPDGNELQRTKQKYGTLPEYTSEEPVYWDEDYWYKFIGWTDAKGNDIEEFKPIKGNTYIYAKYEIGGPNEKEPHEKEPQEACLAEGTLITMADGTRKTIETLKVGDLIKTFNHNTGKAADSKVYDNWKYINKVTGLMTLTFTNDIKVQIVSGHCFFDKQENKYVTINTTNYKQYINHEFYNLDANRWEKLLKIELSSEPVYAYTLVTENDLNCVANGMLNCDDGIYGIFVNIFEFGDNLRIDREKKKADIKEYGLWPFSDANYVTKEAYNAFNLKYMNVAFGKGLLTKEYFEKVGEYSSNYDTSTIRKDKIKDNAEKAGN